MQKNEETVFIEIMVMNDYNLAKLRDAEKLEEKVRNKFYSDNIHVECIVERFLNQVDWEAIVRD